MVLENTDDVVLQCIAPIVSCVVRKIIKRENPFIGDNFDILIRMIDVENITNKFISYSSDFMSISRDFFIKS